LPGRSTASKFPGSEPCADIQRVGETGPMPSKLRSFPYLSSAILAGLVLRLALGGLSAWGVAALALATIWFAFELVRWLLPSAASKRGRGRAPGLRNGGSPDEDEPLVSLVYFLAEAREVDEQSIRNCVASALGIRFRNGDPEAESFVAPFSPPDRRERELHIRHFMVKVPDGLFAVLVSDRPYIENPGEFARDSIRDKRLRTAVERHVAWISVDWMDEGRDLEGSRRAYATIGRILASMGGPDCLAVYCPELQRCNEFDPGLLDALAGGSPLRLFDEPTFEPVIEIADNDPRMKAAVREAVSRWPEFVAAFEASLPPERERFIVKAEFREGRKSEYMWVSVREIDDRGVSGVLMNDPHELIEVHRGAIVSFPLTRLSDWIYPEGDSHVGGFTLDVLAEDEGE
jgi:uncharacterized protein YegJ (DUF2314 family)